MSIPIQAIPVAISALRSLLFIGKRTENILAEQQTQAPLPVMLPPLPDTMVEDLLFDKVEMLRDFAVGGRFRGLLDELGLSEKFDDTMDSTGAKLAFGTRRFLGLFYQARDAADGVTSPGSDGAYPSVAPFLVMSAEAGSGKTAGKLLRMVSDTLLDFLGQTAPIFLSQSRNQMLISTILREFAGNTDLNRDNPERIMKSLLGSVAAAAADTANAGKPPSEHPLALLLIASLGQVRREEDDDFVAQIITRQGFQSVLSDWLTRVADNDLLVSLVASFNDLNDGEYDPTDPSTLPAKLQPVYGGLTAVLKVIGDPEKDALRSDEVLENVFKTVLDGIADHSDALLLKELDGRKAIAELLKATIDGTDRHMPGHGQSMIAPILGASQKLLARTLPHLTQAEAVNRSTTLVQGLAEMMSQSEFMSLVDTLSRERDAAFAEALVISALDLLGDRPDLLLGTSQGHIPQILQEILAVTPDMVKLGMNRDSIEALMRDIVTVVLPADTTEGAFASDVLPVVLKLVRELEQGGLVLAPGDAEHLFRAYAVHFGANRPVWETLIKHDLLEPMIMTAGHVLLRDAAPPQRLTPKTVATILDAVLQANGRHGLAVMAQASGASDKVDHIRALLQTKLKRVLIAVFDQLGKGIDSSQIGALVKVLMDQALLNLGDPDLDDSDFSALLKAQILVLNKGVAP